MPTKYKLYYATESGEVNSEYYEKSELKKFDHEDNEDELWGCAERMMYKFNLRVKDATQKRFAFKLEKVTVRVLGSEAYYGLNISESMCKPDFK